MATCRHTQSPDTSQKHVKTFPKVPACSNSRGPKICSALIGYIEFPEKDLKLRPTIKHYQAPKNLYKYYRIALGRHSGQLSASSESLVNFHTRIAPFSSFFVWTRSFYFWIRWHNTVSLRGDFSLFSLFWVSLGIGGCGWGVFTLLRLPFWFLLPVRSAILILKIIAHFRFFERMFCRIGCWTLQKGISFIAREVYF